MQYWVIRKMNTVLIFIEFRSLYLLLILQYGTSAESMENVLGTVLHPYIIFPLWVITNYRYHTIVYIYTIYMKLLEIYLTLYTNIYDVVEFTKSNLEDSVIIMSLQ